MRVPKQPRARQVLAVGLTDGCGMFGKGTQGAHDHDPRRYTAGYAVAKIGVQVAILRNNVAQMMHSGETMFHG